MADPMASPLFDERESSMSQQQPHQTLSPVHIAAFDSPGAEHSSSRGAAQEEDADVAANASELDPFSDDAAGAPEQWSLQAHLRLHSPPPAADAAITADHGEDASLNDSTQQHDQQQEFDEHDSNAHDESDLLSHTALHASSSPAPASASASQFHSPSEFFPAAGEKGLLDDSVHIPGDPLLRRDLSASPDGVEAQQDAGAEDVILAAQPLSPSPPPAGTTEAHSILADSDSILASAGLSPLSSPAGGLSPLAEVAEDALSPEVLTQKRRAAQQQQQQQMLSPVEQASPSPVSPNPAQPDFSAAAASAASTAAAQEDEADADADGDANVAASYRTVQFTIPKHAPGSSASSRRTNSSGSAASSAASHTPKHRHTMSASVAGSHRPSTSALSSSTARAAGSSSAGGKPPLGSPATGSVTAGTPSRTPGAARNGRRSTAPKDLVWPSLSASGSGTLGTSANASGSPSAPSSPSPAERLARLEERNTAMARELARTAERLEATIKEKEGLSSKLSMLELAREMERLDGGSGGGGGGGGGGSDGSASAAGLTLSSPASSPLSPPIVSLNSPSPSPSIVPPLQFSALSPQAQAQGQTPAHRTGFSWSASAAAAAAAAAGLTLNSSFGSPSSASTPRGQTPQELEIMQGFVKAHSALTAISFKLHENRVGQHKARKELLAASSVPLTPASAAAIESAQNQLSALLKARTALCAELHTAERTRRRVAQRWFDFDLEHAHAIADAGGRSGDGADDDDEYEGPEDEPLDEHGERRPSRKLNIGQALAFSPSSRKKLPDASGGVGVEELQASIAALRAQNQRLELQHAEALRAAEKARADAVAAQAFREAEIARQAEVARFAAESKAIAEKKEAESKALAAKEAAARDAEAALAARVAAEVAKALADREVQRQKEEDAARAAEQARAKQEADELRAQLRAALALQQKQQPEPINSAELGIQSNLHQAVLGLNGSGGAPGSAERRARNKSSAQELMDPTLQEQMDDAAQIEAIQRRMAARTQQQQQQQSGQQPQQQGQGSKRNSPHSSPALTSPDGGRVFSLREFQALQAAQAAQQQSDIAHAAQQQQREPSPFSSQPLPPLESLSPDDERRLLAEAHHRAAQLSAVLAAQDAYLASQGSQLRNQDALIAQQFMPMPDPLLMATASMQQQQSQQQQPPQQPQQSPHSRRQESLELTESLRLMAENQSQIDEVDSAIRDITNTARSRRAQQQQQAGPNQQSQQPQQQMQPYSQQQPQQSLEIASADQRVADQRRRDEELHRQFLATQPSLYEQMLVRPRPSPQHQQAQQQQQQFAATQPLQLSQFQPLPQQTPQSQRHAMPPSTPDASFLRSVQFTPNASPRASSSQQSQQMQPYNQQQQPHQQMAQSLVKQQQRSAAGGPVAARAVPSASKLRSGLSATEPTRSQALSASSSAHPAHLYTSRNAVSGRALNPAQSHVVHRMVEVATLADPAAAAKVARVEKAHAAAVEKHAAQIRAQADQRAAQQQEKLAKLLALNARDENAVVPLPASSHHPGSAKKKRASSAGAMRPAPALAPLQHAPPPSAYLPDGALMLRTAANERRMSSSGGGAVMHEQLHQLQQLQPGGYSSAGNSARSSRATSPARRGDMDSQQQVAPSDLHLQLQAVAARGNPPPSSSPSSSFAATSASYPLAPGSSPAFAATAPAAAYPSSSPYAHLNGAAHAQQSPVVSHTMNGSYANDPAASYLFGSAPGAARYTPASSPASTPAPVNPAAAAAASAPITEYVSGGEALAVLENARARYRAQLLQEQADRLAMQQQLQQQQREEQQRMQMQQQQQQQSAQEQPERTEY